MSVIFGMPGTRHTANNSCSLYFSRCFDLLYSVKLCLPFYRSRVEFTMRSFYLKAAGTLSIIEINFRQILFSFAASPPIIGGGWCALFIFIFFSYFCAPVFVICLWVGCLIFRFHFSVFLFSIYRWAKYTSLDYLIAHLTLGSAKEMLFPRFVDIFGSLEN